MLSELGEMAFCRRHAMKLSKALLSFHQIICSRGCPQYGLHGSFFCGRLTTTGGMVGVTGPSQVGCQELPCAEAASHR